MIHSYDHLTNDQPGCHSMDCSKVNRGEHHTKVISLISSHFKVTVYYQKNQGNTRENTEIKNIPNLAMLNEIKTIF